MDSIVSFITNNQATIITVLALVLSELLSLNPSAESNGLIQLGLSLIKKAGVTIPGALLLLCCLGGCTTINHAMNRDTPDAILTSQDTAAAVVYGFEAAFEATPQIVDALLKNGTISPHTYNTQILPAYNRGLASLNVLIAALKSAHDAKADPNHMEAYTLALAQFLTDKAAVDNLLVALGGGK